MIPVSDSEEEVITRKPKSSKVFNSDDEASDNDKASEKSSGFVDHSDNSQESSKSLTSKSGSDNDQRTNATKKVESDDTSVKSKRSSSSEDEGRSRSRKSSNSSNRSRSRSGSRKSSSSSDRSKSKSPAKKSNSEGHRSRKSDSSSDRSASVSRSRKSSSSSSRSRSRSQSRKSSSSSSRSRSKSRSRKSSSSSSRSRSRSRSRKSSSSSSRSRSRSRSRKSSSSSNRSRSRSRSRKSSSSSDRSKSNSPKKSNSPNTGSHQSRKSDISDEEKLSQSRKFDCSDDDRPSQSQSKKSDSSDNENRRRSQKSDTSDDEIKPRSQAKKSLKRNQSRKLDSSDDEIKPPSQTKKSLKRSQSRKLDSSDDENQSVSSRTSKTQDSDKEESNTSPKPTTDSNKSGGKFSLITESDLESENDERPLVNESASDEEVSSHLNKKAKKLHKKKSSPRKKSKSKINGPPELADSSGSDDEERSSPKRVQKSTAKRKNESKPAKGSKSSKKEKDPLLSIRSETQRMIREGRISLPYHQPKQRSLHEFLQRRKAAPSIPLKATSEVLKTVCEQLTIKQKEVEDFYKSESDHSEAEPESNNLPETNTTNETNDTAKDVEPTSTTSETNITNEVSNIAKEVEPMATDSIVENNELSVEMEHENELDCTLVNCHDNNENISSICPEQEKDTNSVQVTEPVDSGKSNQNDENPPQKKSVEISIPEEDTFEHIIANGSNSSNISNSKPDPVTPMDVDIDTKTSKPNETVAKSNECDNEQDIPDSENFVLTIEDSCPIDTDDQTKPSNEPEPKIPDSEDFVLSLEDSPCKDTENQAQKEPEPNSSNISESISKPIITKDRMKSRIEALLSTRNIKLSDIKLKSALEPIQFEIPTFCQEPSGIHKLKEKFIKHSMAKNKPKSVPTQLNVVTTQTDTDGEVTGITKETLTLGLNDDENEFADPKFKAPGAKHAYLKKKILDMLISKKEATWNEYQNEKRRYYGSDPEAENDIDDEDDSATCKKLNFEPYHPEDEPDDDELIEDDLVYKEKTRDKNCYLDEEAEVSDDDEDETENLSVQDEEDEGENPAVEEDDDDARSVDSDGLDFTVKNDSPLKPAKPSDTTEFKKLFKYNTTGSELENKLLGLESISQPNSSENISTSQILELCSGEFVTQELSKVNNAATDNADDDFFVADSQNVEDSQNICLSFPDTDNTIEKSTEPSKKDTLSKPEDTSDNEDEEEIIVRKKPTMRIVEDSDDEIIEQTNDANEDDTSDQEIAANDDQDEENVEDEEDVGGDDIEAEEFGYNSEEELVTYDKAAARGFLENEAELSGSEWGSEDENERDLDTLEKEAGDDDEIDADKLKEELGKIHMRQLLDDDQHDVRLLKEMLLEDGELHSDAKRQRKFQWKNLADGDDFFKNHSYDSDDENNLNDDEDNENEEHWRKIRHERETFLSQQEQRKSVLSETMTETIESSFIQFTTSTKIINENVTTTIIQRASSNLTSLKNKPDQDIPKINSKFKCGSFLSKGKLLMSKMSLPASDNKGNINGPKNGKNFVFGARSPEKEQVSVPLSKPAKRKLLPSSPSMTKRKKLIVENANPGANSILAQLALSEEL